MVLLRNPKCLLNFHHFHHIKQESLNLWLNISYVLALMSVSDIGYVKIVLRTSAENYYKLKFRNFFRTYLHVLVFSWIQFQMFWMLLDYFSVLWQMFYPKSFVCKFIVFRLSFKTFFWRYMLSLYLLLQILLKNVFLKETSIWFVILVAGLRIISPHPRYAEQVCFIVSGLLGKFGALPKIFAAKLFLLDVRGRSCLRFW